jgi:hypothetical protein
MLFGTRWKRPVRTTTFDYPQPGPADIYALGVPRDAAIFDTRPEGAALALIDEVQRRFERGLGDHLAVVLESWLGNDGTLEPCEIVVLRQKGTLKRSDHYYAFNFQSNPRVPATLYRQIKEAWPNLTIPQVLSLESDATRQRQMLFDGHRTLIRSVRDGQTATNERLTDEFKTIGGGESLGAMIWPNLPLELQSWSSHYKREVHLLTEDPNRPGLIGLQSLGFAQTDEWWFDPNKDYMLVERTRRQQGSVTTKYIVTQGQQASSGRWYPRVICVEGQSPASRMEKRVLLDLSPVFDEGVFSVVGLGR